MKTLLKIYLLFLFTISIYTNANAQKPVTWQKVFGLDSNVQGKYGIQSLDGGYAILAQWGTESVYRGWTRVLKLDKFGNLVWSRNYGVKTYNSIIEDSDSGFVLIGSGGVGAALFKINSTGDSILYKTFGGTSIYDFYYIKKYYDGGFILTGEGSNGLNGFGYILRIDQNLNTIWSNVYSSINYEDLLTRDITFDKNNNIAVTLYGYISNYSDGGLLKLTPDGNQYLMKFDVTPLISDNYNYIIPINGKYAVTGGADFPFDSVSSVYCLLDTNGNLLTRKYYYDNHSRYVHMTNAGANNFALGGHHINTLADAKMGIRKIDYSGNIIWTRIIKNALTVSAPWSMSSTSDYGFLLIGNYENVPADAYCVYIIKTDSNAIAEPLGISDEEFMIPEEFVLYQNYPNPFNPFTKIKYEIKKKAHYKMRLYDVNGRLISLLIDESVNPGIYEINLGSYFTDLSSSVYFISLENDYQVLTRKLLLLK